MNLFKRIGIACLIILVAMAVLLALPYSLLKSGKKPEQTTTQSESPSVTTQPLLSNCEHKYESTVIKNAVCGEKEEVSYTCKLCGDTYTQESLVNHIVNNDVCTLCGKNVDIKFNYRLLDDQKSYAIQKDSNYNYVDELIIPSQYKGLPVTMVDDNGFQYCRNIKSVVLPDSIIEIGSKAFASCSALQSINLSDSLIMIGSYAFEFCDLPSVTIPAGVTVVSEGVFQYCSELKSVTLSNGITHIGDDAFALCKSLEIVNIPNSVVSLGIRAFNQCTSLSDITIPDSVTEIGNLAFSHTLIKTLILPANIQRINFGTFRDCSVLQQVIMPGSVTVLDQFAFAFCPMLTEITFNGTMADWNNISEICLWEGSDWNTDSPTMTVTCTDGEIVVQANK